MTDDFFYYVAVYAGWSKTSTKSVDQICTANACSPLFLLYLLPSGIPLLALPPWEELQIFDTLQAIASRLGFAESLHFERRIVNLLFILLF